jgi:hypothetical protein
MRTSTYNLTIANGPLRNANAAIIAKRAKNVALFLIAPFIGLAYLLAFPVIGFGMLLWVAAKAVMKNENTRPVALVIASPVIALVFVTVGPIVALGGLVATAVEAALKA